MVIGQHDMGYQDMFWLMYNFVCVYMIIDYLEIRFIFTDIDKRKNGRQWSVHVRST